MNKALVIGYGNTMRGDDGAGPRAAALIAERYPSVTCLYPHELSPELAETIAAYSTVVFVDAQEMGTRLSTSVVHSGSCVPGSHTMTPADLLGIASAVYGTVPEEAILVQVPAFSFDLGEQLSSRTQAYVEQCSFLVGAFLRARADLEQHPDEHQRDVAL